MKHAAICVMKKRFPARADAVRALRSHRSHQHRVGVYRCPWCDGYHIGRKI